MTTSNETHYEETGCEIVAAAFGHVRIISKGQQLRSDDERKGLKLLNGIIKNWQRDGLHLWKNKEAAVFLEANRRVYKLGAPGSIGCDVGACKPELISDDIVHATSGDWVLTKTAAAGIAGEDLLSIESLISYNGITYNTACAMSIGIVNTDKGIDWYSIADVDTLDILINDLFVNDFDKGATVYIYRDADQLEKPLKIYQENVRLFQVGSGYELPIMLRAWTDYNLLPIKNTPGIPVQAYYEPKINNTELALWPVSRDSTNILLFRFQSPFQIFKASTDTQDFPSEWIRALEWALAAEMGPSYGIPLQRQAYLDNKASSLKESVEDWDQDTSSLFLYPQHWGTF